jgi:hypothetical protein
MEELKQNPTLGIILLLVVALIVFGVGTANSMRALRRQREAEAALAARELAVIVEENKVTAGGTFSMLMLVLTILFAVGIFVSAKSAIHEIEAGVVLTAGSVVWGLGIALGRRRTYRVFRSEHREPM